MLSNFDEKYEIECGIGEGAFGSVVKCVQKTTGRTFAAKVLKATCPDFSEISKLSEISILRNLPEHPNVLALHEPYINKTTKQVTLVFELMEQNLLDFIRSDENVGEAQAKRMIFQVINGLEHLHSNHIFHRDIKPENILLRKDYSVVIGDLGSAQFTRKKCPFTEYVATRWYRSPESLLTAGYYGSGLDIWAAGCVFFEVLTKRPLFPGISEIDQLDKIHKVVGTPKQKVLKKFERHKSTNFMYDFHSHQGTGISMLVPFIHKHGRYLLKQMLEYDPDVRASAEQLLRSEYFSDLRDLRCSLYLRKKRQLLIRRNQVGGYGHMISQQYLPDEKKAQRPMISHQHLPGQKKPQKPGAAKFIQSDINARANLKRKLDFASGQSMSRYRLRSGNKIGLYRTIASRKLVEDKKSKMISQKTSLSNKCKDVKNIPKNSSQAKAVGYIGKQKSSKIVRTLEPRSSNDEREQKIIGLLRKMERGKKMDR